MGADSGVVIIGEFTLPLLVPSRMTLPKEKLECLYSGNHLQKKSHPLLPGIQDVLLDPSKLIIAFTTLNRKTFQGLD